MFNAKADQLRLARRIHRKRGIPHGVRERCSVAPIVHRRLDGALGQVDAAAQAAADLQFGHNPR